ncbi:MAG: class I SAM-dependent RNA methyltransferase [Actinomycetota bacterium]|nr:methyltransferase [Actinomycetota bacterium]
MKQGTVELEIERIVAGGLGLARTPGGVVLVRGALPGERVSARPAVKSGVLRAHAIEILDPHPHRVDIALPPGADLPLEYDEQLPVKQSLVEEALARIGKVDAKIEQIHPSPRSLAYRTAAQYAAAPGGGLAARAQDSDRLVRLVSDPLVAEPIAQAFAICAERSLHGIEEVVLRASLHAKGVLAGLIGERKANTDRIARALEDGGVAGVIWAEPDPIGRFRGRTRLLNGAERLIEDFGVHATVAVQSFSQVNPLAARGLYREAAELAGTGERAIDLYAGAGVLGLHLAGSFKEVIAVEINADAVRRGEADARRLGAGTLTFHRGDARSARHFLPADVLVVDPPRAGLTKEVAGLISENSPARIVYVSCDPTTWARDVRRLCQTGYGLTFARPYDFYPFTHHVEVLSLLERQ